MGRPEECFDVWVNCMHGVLEARADEILAGGAGEAAAVVKRVVEGFAGNTALKPIREVASPPFSIHTNLSFETAEASGGLTGGREAKRNIASGGKPLRVLGIGVSAVALTCRLRRGGSYGAKQDEGREKNFRGTHTKNVPASRGG